MARSGATDLDQDLSGPRLGDVDVPQLGRLLPLDQLVGLHRSPPQTVSTAHALTPGAP